MRKSLITLTVSLALCGGVAAAIIAGTAQAQAPAHGAPMLLAQATPPANRLPPPGGRRGPSRIPVSGADRSARLTQLCQIRYARAAGNMAYLEARLDLTAQQSAVFARWRNVRLDTARRQAAACAARPMPAPPAANQPRPAPPSPVERMTREQTRLQQRLADIQAERPALEALYNTLTPEQRQRFALRQGGMERGMMGGGMGRGPMMRGRMMRGRGPDGPMGPNPMRRGPNPPPPQP